MSVKQDPNEDEEGNHGPEVPLVETNRFGFIIGNGETDSEGPCPELVRHRESKWLGLMTQWEQVMEKKSHKVKSQCQKGIPASVRAKCWPLLCGAKDRKERNSKLYNSLVEAPDHQGWIEIIKRDTDRQFPFHEMFQSKDGHGQKDLLEVLKAYTQYRPDEGYCQAQGPVAAVLLMNMPAEEAFWCLVQISELYLPGYYSPMLEGVLFDAAVLSSVLKKLCPAAHKHLQGQGVEPLMFTTDWLMCLFSRHLPFNTLLRVWDLFFCYGVRVLFQVAVVLVRQCLGDGRLRKECDGQMETLERLRSVKERVQNEQTDAFIHEVCSVSLSLADLQKQTEKELEKWKKDRPNSTFDPRGRCHGHRMAWERAQDKQKEHEKKERQKGSLTIPIMRSHSSLSPSLLRKKWRKRSSKTDTEEWDGGGRKFSQSLMEESDDEKLRRRSLCAIVGEQKAKQDRLTEDLCAHKHKDHNTHPKIALVVSSSIDSDVFEKEPSEAPLRRHTGDSETTHGNEKRRSPACIIEESIQRHQHTVEKDRKLDDMNTEGQIIQNTDKQTCQDEQISEKKNTPVEKEDKQTDSSKQEEEIQSNRDIQEEDIQTEEGKQEDQTESRLPQVIVHDDSLQNNLHVIQEEQMCRTSGDQQDDHEHQEELNLSIHTATKDDKHTPPIGEHHTDVDKEERFQEEFNVLPEKTQIAGPSDMGEETGEKRIVEEMQEVSLEERDNHQEAMQTPGVVLTSSSLQTEEESEAEHPDRSADLIQQSQSCDPENNDMDSIILGEELAHCAVDSTVGDLLESGTEQSDVGGTNTLEPQEETEALRLSEDNGMGAATVITPDDTETSEISSENKSAISAHMVCCDIKSTEELCNLTHSINVNNKVNATSESVTAESSVRDSDVGSQGGNDMYVTTRFGNLENNMTDVTTGSEMPESSDVQTAVGTGILESNTVDSTVKDSESNQVVITTESGNLEQSDNPENDILDLVVGSDNLSVITEEPIIVGTDPVCNLMHHNDESGNPDANTVDSAVCNPKNIDVLTTNVSGSPECNDIPISCVSGDPESNAVNLADGSGNQDQNEVHVTTDHENPQSDQMEIAVAAVNSDGSNGENTESNKVFVTPESGNLESNDIQVTSGSGILENKDTSPVESGDPDNEKVNTISRSAHPETNKEHVTAVSGNPTEESAAGSDNPPNTECAIPVNSQEFESPFPIPSSKSPHQNLPPNQLRVRRTSSSRVFYPTILSEDTFREPQQQEHTHTENTAHTLTDDTSVQPTSPTKSGQKRMGLFRRLRGENNKTPIPKILIQDFSEKDERLTSKERRRRKREKERKEKEEKDRKKQEKEMEKDKERERKKPQTRGKSFQVLSKKGVDNAVSPENSDVQTSRTRRNSAPFSDSYF